jgi:hypothetical protein
MGEFGLVVYVSSFSFMRCAYIAMVDIEGWLIVLHTKYQPVGLPVASILPWEVRTMRTLGVILADPVNMKLNGLMEAEAGGYVSA